MSRILIIEDDQFKFEEVRNLLLEVNSAFEILHVTTVVDAVHKLQAETFLLVIIDMALPSHPVVSGGGAPISQLSGGLEVLFELQALGRDDPCVVLTQWSEMEICGEHHPVRKAAKVIEEQYEIRGVTCIEYLQNGAEWRGLLKEVLRAI